MSLVKMLQNLYRITGKSLLGLGTHNVRQKCKGLPDNMKVTIIGGAGRVGKALTLMLKQSPLIDELSLYDIKNTEGIAEELNYVDTNCKVFGFSGQNMSSALIGSKIVVILASAPECDHLEMEHKWTPNSRIVTNVINEVVKQSPNAFLAIGTDPLNSIVPMACQLMKKSEYYNPNTIFGITTVNAVRANTFTARVLDMEPERVLVPVIGGHTADTIIPVLSQTKPAAEFTNEELENITKNVKQPYDQLVQLQPETGSLASSFACARFVISLVKAIKGYEDIVECAYVRSEVHPDLKYLATPLLLGTNGIQKNLGIPSLNNYESCMFDNTIIYLNDDIRQGEKFGKCVG